MSCSCSCEKPSVLNINLDLGYWFQVYSSYFRYFLIKGHIEKNAFDAFIKKFESLGLKLGCEANLDFKDLNTELSPSLSQKEKDIISQINEKEATRAAEKLVIKDICDCQTRDLYDCLNNFKQLAFDFRYLVKNSNFSLENSLGCRFSIFFKDLQLLINQFHLNRRFIECFNFSGDASPKEVDSFEIQNFLTQELDLFPIQFQSKSIVNWFFLSIKELSKFVRRVVSLITFMQKESEVFLGEMDEFHLENIISACDRVNQNLETFSSSLEFFKILMIDISNLFSNLNRVCLNMKVNEKIFKPYESHEYLDSLYLKIFGERLLEENLNYIFLDGPEIRNILHKLSSKINDYYLNREEPVCLIFENRESIPFVGQLIPHLTFPCKVVALDDLSKESVGKKRDITDNREAIFLGTFLNDAGYIDRIRDGILQGSKVSDLKIGFLFASDNLASTPINIDFLGEFIPHKEWVGFGVDPESKYCNVDSIGVLKD